MNMTIEDGLKALTNANTLICLAKARNPLVVAVNTEARRKCINFMFANASDVDGNRFLFDGATVYVDAPDKVRIFAQPAQ